MGQLAQRVISNEDAAKIANSSVRSIKRAKVIHERGTPEEIAAVESGKASLHSVAEKIAQKRNSRRTGVEIKRDVLYSVDGTRRFLEPAARLRPSRLGPRSAYQAAEGGRNQESEGDESEVR